MASVPIYMTNPSTALQEYLPRIAKHYRHLMDIFTKQSRSCAPVDVSKFHLDLFFDVVSDLTLGESFNSLTANERHPILKDFVRRHKAVGFVILNMWIFHLIKSVLTAASCLLYTTQWVISILCFRKQISERSSHKHEWYKDALRKRSQVCVQLTVRQS